MPAPTPAFASCAPIAEVVGWVELLRDPTPPYGKTRSVVSVGSRASALDPTYELAFAHRSGRSAFFQSGMAEIFFSRSSTSASLCRPDATSLGKPGATSTRASALEKVSRDMV